MTDHGIPAIDRALEILDCIGLNSAPMTIREITAATGLARSTVYRTLNSLVAHGVVRQATEQAYCLGPHLLKLARAVPQGLDLVTASRDVLNDLANRLGTSAKLSIVDGSEALVVAVAESPGVYSITTQVGRRFPLHAGAASKVLLAHLPPDRCDAILSGRLSAFTRHTIVAPARLRVALEQIRTEGVAHDLGEHTEGVRAVAAPVFDRSGLCIAAVSVPFTATADDVRIDEVATAVRDAAEKLSASLLG